MARWNKLKWIYLLLLVGSLFSCQPREKEIAMPAGMERWVLNSRITGDGMLLVSLSRTLPPDQLSGGEELLQRLAVSGMQVSLEYQGSSFGLEEAGGGVYILADPAWQAGERALLRVKDPVNGKELYSETVVTPLPEVDSIAPEARIGIRDTSCRVRVELSSLDAHKRWYLLSFQKWDTRVQVIPKGRASLKQVLNQTEKMSEKVVLISSDSFKNGKYTLQKELPYIHGTDTLVVMVSEIEDGYRKFLETQLRSSNWINQLMGEVINYPSNVKNGMGYFTLHRPRVFIYRMEKYLK